MNTLTRPPIELSSKTAVRLRSLSWQWLTVMFVVFLIAGIALRFWRLGTSPAWQWDEAVYWRVSANVQHGVLAEHSVYGIPWEPFLFQPPVYFLVVAQWFNLVGGSVYHARVLGVVWTALTQVILFRLLWRIHGPRVALFAIVPIVFDGWLLYIERVSYIENALMPLVVGSLLLYNRALDRPSWMRFLIGGLAVGAAASFKQTGAYVLIAVLLCWLVTRREHRGHLILVAAAIAVIVTYLIVMARMFNLPGHPWFADQSLVQIRRVLGLQKSGGTLTSVGGALHLLAAQYRFFAFSILLAGLAFLLAVRRTWQCYLARNWLPARDNALLYSWLSTGIVIFGFSSLKFPQYFALILIPAYCYLWTELARWPWRSAWKVASMGLAVIVGLGSFLLTIPAFGANSLAEVQQYATVHIPDNAVVVTEQSIGDLIQQRWCTVEKADACVGVASYAITWSTYLQSSFDLGDPAFAHLMKGAVAIKSFSGAVGTATVWKLRSTP